MNTIIPDLQSAVLCDDVRQERNGKFILIGLFDAIWVQSLPTRYPRLFMATRWCSGEGTFHQRSRILKPDGTSVLVEGQNIPVTLASAEATATNVEIFLNIEFQTEGTHWVEVLLDGDLKIRYPLRVGIAKGQQGQPPPSA
ncbi:MAG: hypothetical protein H3C50_06660 [Kiritimatiellae bacterium]|nr:hypothetical protein [Kiritimatiellia bacterium]MCO5067703.1 hypothetical protein [Kiritimatiellia bacterium]